jgi:hypothetical protein
VSEVTLPQRRGTNARVVSSAGLECIGQVATQGTITTWPTAKLIMYYPFSISRGMTITELMWENGTTNSGNVQVGVYNSAFVLLGSCASTGQTGGSAIQVAAASSSFFIPAGQVLYFAISQSDGAGQIITIGVPAQAGTLAAFGVMSETTGSFGLPATATPTVPTNELLAFVAVSDTTTA